MDICDIHFAAKGHIYARLFHGHSILFIRYAALLRYCSPMRLSCLFLERRVSLSLDTVSFYDSDGSYVLLRDGPYYMVEKIFFEDSRPRAKAWLSSFPKTPKEKNYIAILDTACQFLINIWVDKVSNFVVFSNIPSEIAANPCQNLWEFP